MSASDMSGNGDEAREAELLRVNAELAVELRRLTAAGAASPHTAVGPAGRRVARLLAERDSLQAERDSLSSELQANRAEVERLSRHTDELAGQIRDQAQHVEALSREVSSLRGGAAGALRRLRARLLRNR